VNIPHSRFAILKFDLFRRLGVALAFFALTLVPSALFSQTVATGSIVGVVSDAQENLLARAKVEITNKTTAARIHVATSALGVYSSGPIQPGDYSVRIEATGFKAAELSVTVRVGNTVNGSVKMLVGVGPKIENPNEAGLNIDQATVQGVLNGDLVQSLPISGRNFFDLAQLEPGVQPQDGGVLDAGKNGISGVSILGRYGRSENVSLDGVEINDEIVGSMTQNIPAGAIKEFQVAQSMLDLSTGPTSSGAVNVITRSGSDQIHGELFGVYRGDPGAASLPGGSSFDRELFGADAGGAIIKDKIFWFADAERAIQNLTAAEPFTAPFDTLNATLNEPYREFNTDERVDWNMRGSTRAFYRFNFFENNDLHPFGSASSTQQLRNTNNTLTNALGVDFNTGLYAHSLRFEYLKLRSNVADVTSALSSLENPIPGLGINIGAYTAGNCALSDGGNYCGGPSALGPEQTVQSNKFAKYDGTRVLGSHVFRYGATLNRIDGARLASYSVFPQVGTTSLMGSTSADPTSYAAEWVSLGNGIGATTAQSAFGFPAGGVSPDDRIELYAGDGWKASPKLTVTYGLLYVHDTGRTDSGLGALPALTQWGPGYNDKIRNPNLNLAPQFGFAWDAGGDGKTVIRGGGGLFYDNALWNNVLLDSPARLSNGIFANTPEVCSGGVASPFAWPTSLAGITSIAGGAATVINTPTGPQALPTFCGGTISSVSPSILALSSAFQAAAASVTRSQANPNFLGTTLSALNPSSDLLYPGYRTPRSWQMNLGIDKEIRPGTVLSLNYIRNIGEHFLIGQDINHSGAARSFNQANALAARDAAQLANGCPAGLNQATCMIGKLGQAGAQAAYSAAGLDSNIQANGGLPCSYCAFPGTNPITGNNGTVGGVDMQFPEGRSVYSGFQLKLVQRIEKPTRGIKAATFQAAYTYSKYISQVLEQNGVNLATDNDDPTRFTGPNAMDRKHQVSFGGTFDLPLYLRFSMVGHFYSPLAQNLDLPELTNGGEIFATDWLGSGLGSNAPPEPVPGTQVGEFQRSANINNLQSVLNNYNKTYAGLLTPAGECLVANQTASANPLGICPGQVSGPQVMTQADLVDLGWVMPTLDSMPAHAVGFPWQKSLDLKLSWPRKVKEGITIEPSATIFNVFNFANDFLPGNLPSASLLPGLNGALAPNAVGGVVPGSSLTPFRSTFQSGTFALGTPRALEFALHITF